MSSKTDSNIASGYGPLDSQSALPAGCGFGVYSPADTAGFDVSDLIAWPGSLDTVDPQTGWQPRALPLASASLWPADTALPPLNTPEVPHHAQGYSIYWTAQNGYWNVASSWNLDRLPQYGDDVGINTANLYTITVDSGTYTVNTLTVGNDNLEISGGSLTIDAGASFANALIISGGTLALGANDVTVSGQFTQDGGTISSTGTLTLAGGSTFANGGEELMTGSGTTVLQGASAISGGNYLFVDGGGSLQNSGTLTLSGGSEIVLGQNPFGTTSGGGTLQNNAGATINFDSSSGGGIFAGSGTLIFTNAGLVENTGSGTGSNATQIGVAFTNTGTLAVNAGELQLNGGGSSSGTTTIASGALLDFDGGSSSAFTFSGGTVGGNGMIELDSGTLTVTGSIISTALNLYGGSLVATGGSTTMRAPVTNDVNIVVQGGALAFNDGVTGTGTITIDNGEVFLLNSASTTLANYVDVVAGSGTADLIGGSGNDVFQFAGDFQASDKINGNGGTNTLILDGDYSAGLTFGKTTMVNMQTIALDSGYSYNLTINKATVAAHQTMTVDGSSLGSGDTLTFSGGGTKGDLVIYGSTGGDDVLTGGKGQNMFVGDGASDTINCKVGTCTVAYSQASDSTSTGFDTVSFFNAGKDQFSVFSAVTNIDPMYKGGTLDASNFDADLAAAMSGRLTANGAIIYEATSGSYAKDLFLVIDENGQAGYQAGQDLVIEVPKFKGTLTTSNFLLNDAPPPPTIPDIGGGNHHQAGSEHQLGDHFHRNIPLEGFGSGRSALSAHIANPAVAAALHQNAGGTLHDGSNDHHAFGAGPHETLYHSQLDALSTFGHHTGLTDQFALPHVEYFGS